MTRQSGHCFCGAVTWVHEGRQTRNLNCHCDECRRGVSGAFTAVKGLSADGMAIHGPWRDYRYTSESSRAFCAVCGTRIWFRSDLWPDAVFVNVGALDRPEDHRPDRHVLYGERVPWAHVTDDLPKSERFHMPVEDVTAARLPDPAPGAGLAGRCLCGDVTWASDADQRWTGHCHCDSCRRATGAPFATFLNLPREAVTWGGAMIAFASSGDRVTRRFCESCGTHMSYATADRPDEVDLYAASLIDASGFAPRYHFHFDERLAWLRVDPDLPKPAPA